MELFNLGKVTWRTSQLLYHALAELGREALALVSPAEPYVCLGFHQNPVYEIDLDYCQTHHIPVFRRDLGGGGVFLDGNQYFFQVIVRKDHPGVTRNKEVFYRRFIQPAIEAYRRVGIPAQYKPINDIVVGYRKICGAGVGEMGPSIAFVGNLIYDFDYETMARVLKLPDEKFRDKVHKTMRENLSTIRRELGDRAAAECTEEKLNSLMVEEFGKLLGPFEPGRIDAQLEDKMAEIGEYLTGDSWFFRKGKKYPPGRRVKIRAGLDLVHRIHQAPGGLIRADLAVNEGRLEQVSLSGDVFRCPKEALDRLETDLEGVEAARAAEIVANFHREHNLETPGIEIEDWLKVLLG